MRYLAKREITLRTGHKVKPGEEISAAEIASWGEAVKRAHLNMEWVVAIPELPPADVTLAAPEDVPVVVAEPGEAPPADQEEDPHKDPTSPFVCATCGESFTTAKALRKHKH